MHNFVLLDLFVFPSIAPWFVLCSHYRLSYGGILVGKLFGAVIPKTNERLEPCLTSVVSCWRIPIFPGRLQPSIVGTTELNFCVRNGNRWTLCVNLTNYPSMLSTDYCIIQASLCQVSTCLRSTCYVTLWKILFTRKVFSSASRSSQLFSCSFRSLAGCTFRDSNPGPTD